MQNASAFNMLLLAALFGLVGCATHADRAAALRQSFHQGNLQSALAETDPEKLKGQHDADVLKLNRAMIQLAAGEAGEAEKLLRQMSDLEVWQALLHLFGEVKDLQRRIDILERRIK